MFGSNSPLTWLDLHNEWMESNGRLPGNYAYKAFITWWWTIPLVQEVDA